LSNKWLSVAAQPPLTVTQETVLGAALAALGALHAKGLWQDDLHLDNLLCYENKLFWVDVGSIRNGVLGRPLALGQVLANLGVFFAQLPANFDPFAGQLLEYYERGGGLSCLPITVLQNKVSKIRYARLNDFITKTGRDCSLFSVRRGPMELRAVCRNEVDSLQSLLADPDQFISHGQILKDGGSATVARVSVGDKVVVVKRYNIKGLGHWLRRFWRPTRALHAWRQAHLLIFLGVTTSQPLAMLERRCCWLRGCAYLVTEYLPGENILARFASHVNGAPPPAELTALERLFATLIRERISHGDLKGSNLIWHDGGWALIDLDATRHHKTSYGFARAYTRDRTRLLKNWPVESPLRRVLEARIPQFRP
jgi:tRNA A-37 threonylcarbamoyl transferase component Bud32